MEHFLGHPECKHYEMFEERPADWYKVEFARLFWGLCNEVDRGER